MKVNWNFPGGELQKKKASAGEHGYFLELHNDPLWGWGYGYFPGLTCNWI